MKSVREYGAVGNGKTDDLAAIQKALRTEKELFFPCGVYILTDTLKIPSDRLLRFEEGAALKLQAETQRKRGDFLLTNENEKTGDENITIIGATLDGNGSFRNHKRPKDIFQQDGYSGVLINFCNVKNLTLRNIILQNPVAYYTRFCLIDGFLLEDITFKSDRLRPNQDGIHFAGEVRNGVVRKVRADSYGQTNDDLLAINADDFPGRIEEFDTVCGDIENVLFEDVYAESCHDAIRLLSFRSTIRNLTFQNLNVGFRRNAVDANAARGCRAELFKEKDYPRGVGRIENIVFENCTFWHTREYPAFWNGSLGSIPHPFIKWGSLSSDVRFIGCRFVAPPPLKTSFLKKHLGRLVFGVCNDARFPAFELKNVSDQTVVADGKKYEVKQKTDALTLSEFSDLTIL